MAMDVSIARPQQPRALETYEPGVHTCHTALQDMNDATLAIEKYDICPRPTTQPRAIAEPTSQLEIVSQLLV